MRVVVMGVTGCGKSTVGAHVADALGAAFIDGDSLHSPQSIAKMAAGTPLDDDDRWPWLAQVGQWLASHDNAVVACSALRRAYRDAIRVHASDAVFVHLAAPQAVLEPRVRLRAERDGHFAGAGLLDSQYALLEPLELDELGATVDVARYDAAGATAAALEFLAEDVQ